MKWQAIITVAAIALSIALPSSLPIFTDQGRQAAIGTLDVCHSTTPALSSSGDMPCINECPGQIRPSAFITVIEISDTPCEPTVLAFQDEHPPKA
jgi:hypothetical protein